MMQRNTNARQRQPFYGQEFVTPSGLLGWIDRDPRGFLSAELSFYSRWMLARENNSRLMTDEMRKYFV